MLFTKPTECQQVEERKKAILEAEKERREAVLRRSEVRRLLLTFLCKFIFKKLQILFIKFQTKFLKIC